MKRMLFTAVILLVLPIMGGCGGPTSVSTPARFTVAVTPTAHQPTAIPTFTPKPTAPHVAVTAALPFPTARPTPTSPTRVTAWGAVTDVRLSDSVISLKSDNGIVYLTLTPKTKIFGANGNPIRLRNIWIGEDIEAKGWFDSKGTINPSEVRVLPEKIGISPWHLVVQKADGSFWDVPTDGRQPRSILPPPAHPSSSGYLLSVSPYSGLMAYVHFVDWRLDDAAGTLNLLDLRTSQLQVILKHLLPPGMPWQKLPDDADRAALIESKPVWNHAGTAFVFVSAHEGKANLYEYDLKSGKIRLLAAPPHNAAWPRWSPDDTQVLFDDIGAFSVGAGISGVSLWVVRVQGSSRPRQVTPYDERSEAAVFAWVNNHQVLTADRSLMGIRNPAVLDIETGKHLYPVNAAAFCGLPMPYGKEFVVPAEAPGKPGTMFWVVGDNGCANLWQLPRPIKVGNAVGFTDKYLMYEDHEGRCFAYARSTNQSTQRPVAWCNGTMSPDGRYSVRTVIDHLTIVSLRSGKKIEVDLPNVHNVLWSPDSSVLIAIRVPKQAPASVFRIDPETGKVLRLVGEIGTKSAWGVKLPLFFKE